MPGGSFARFIFLLVRQMLNHFACNARRRNDHAFAVFLQHFAVNPWPRKNAFAHAVEMRARGQLDEILVANLVLGQQQQMIIILAALGHRRFDRTRSHIRFNADNWLDVGFFGGGVKLHRAIHHAVVGQGDAVHPQFGSPLGDGFGRGIAVQQAIFRMNMEMHKIVHDKPRLKAKSNRQAETKSRGSGDGDPPYNLRTMYGGSPSPPNDIAQKLFTHLIYRNRILQDQSVLKSI